MEPSQFRSPIMGSHMALTAARASASAGHVPPGLVPFLASPNADIVQHRFRPFPGRPVFPDGGRLRGHSLRPHRSFCSLPRVLRSPTASLGPRNTYSLRVSRLVRLLLGAPFPVPSISCFFLYYETVGTAAGTVLLFFFCSMLLRCDLLAKKVPGRAPYSQHIMIRNWT